MTTHLPQAYNKQRTCEDKRSLCHAPGYSMHLSQNGLVAACSYTRFMPLGKYPDQTLDEIWFGPTAEGIRKEMRKSEFPKGCGVCSAAAAAGNYDQMRAKLYESYARKPFDKLLEKTKNKIQTGRFAEYPRVMSFELSNTCNLECVMCLGLLSSSIRKNREKLPPLPQKYGNEFLSQLKPYIPHLQEAKFFGGEPFLIDLYLDIWELFVELNPNCKIYITTNGTILNNRVRRILENLPNFQMVISLDAITKPTYEKIRVNGQFDRVMEHLRYFKEVSEKHARRLIISPTYMTHNWMEYPQLLDFANRENLLFETNILITPYELSLTDYSPAQLERVIELWAETPVFVPDDEVLAGQNRMEFDKALNQVRFMLKEQTAFYAHPLGQKLSEFLPANKMELCLMMHLKHELRTTRDPALPLRLKELWAEGGPMLEKLCDAAARLSAEVYGVAVENSLPALRQKVGEAYGDRQLEIAKKLLGNQTDTVSFVEALKAGNGEVCWQLVVKHAETIQEAEMAEADFF